VGDVAVTVDVEGDYNTDSLRGVDEALPRILEGCAARHIPLTLFVTGDVARARPALIRAAMRSASDEAYVAVSRPVEGPILSVARAAAVVGIVLAGIAIMFSEGGGGVRKLAFVGLGIAIMFAAVSFFLDFFGFAGGAVL
jgi:type IV secretion system protein VirB2